MAIAFKFHNQCYPDADKFISQQKATASNWPAGIAEVVKLAGEVVDLWVEICLPGLGR